jgi:hypothetical protein
MEGIGKRDKSGSLSQRKKTFPKTWLLEATVQEFCDSRGKTTTGSLHWKRYIYKHYNRNDNSIWDPNNKQDVMTDVRRSDRLQIFLSKNHCIYQKTAVKWMSKMHPKIRNEYKN